MTYRDRGDEPHWVQEMTSRGHWADLAESQRWRVAFGVAWRIAVVVVVLALVVAYLGSPA